MFDFILNALILLKLIDFSSVVQWFVLHYDLWLGGGRLFRLSQEVFGDVMHV